jgi:tripartite-type tricarboxylate transporter receptor subunit TctC
VPYRGAGAAVNDLVAGHIDIIIDLAPNSLAHVHAGTIKAYAVLASARMAAAPDVPSVDEAGLPGFHMSAWQG